MLTLHVIDHLEIHVGEFENVYFIVVHKDAHLMQLAFIYCLINVKDKDVPETEVRRRFNISPYRQRLM